MSKKNQKAAPAQEAERAIFESIALTRTNDGWVVLQCYTQGKQLLAVEASEPDIVGVAKGQFKLLAGRLLAEGSEVSKERWQEIKSRLQKGG